MNDVSAKSASMIRIFDSMCNKIPYFTDSYEVKILHTSVLEIPVNLE